MAPRAVHRTRLPHPGLRHGVPTERPVGPPPQAGLPPLQRGASRTLVDPAGRGPGGCVGEPPPLVGDAAPRQPPHRDRDPERMVPPRALLPVRQTTSRREAPLHRPPHRRRPMGPRRRCARCRCHSRRQGPPTSHDSRGRCPRLVGAEGKPDEMPAWNHYNHRARPVSTSRSCMIYDMVIVGGGPAGLSAAMWAARYRRSALVVDDGEQRNRWADVSHGFLTRDAADPLQLLRDGREELRRYPTVEFCEGQATHVSRDTRERFVVHVGADEVVGLRLILATGVVDRFPVIDGFFEHYGASVFHCATCDGYDARGHSVVILGWGEHVAAFAIGLLDWARTITVVTEGRPLYGGPDHRTLLSRHGIRVIEGGASALLGRRGS